MQKAAFSHWTNSCWLRPVQPSTPQFSLLQPTTFQFSLVKTSTVQNSPVLLTTAQYSPVQHSAVHYSQPPPVQVKVYHHVYISTLSRQSFAQKHPGLVWWWFVWISNSESFYKDAVDNDCFCLLVFSLFFTLFLTFFMSHFLSHFIFWLGGYCLFWKRKRAAGPSETALFKGASIREKEMIILESNLESGFRNWPK